MIFRKQRYYLEFYSELYHRKIKDLLVGGLSVNLYGVPRVTQAIDIIVSLDKENILNLLALLKDGLCTQAASKSRRPCRLSETGGVDSRKEFNSIHFYHRKENYKVVGIVLVHPLDFSKAYQRKTIKCAKDIEIYLVSLDDLITMKMQIGRDQDISDINLLKRIRELEGLNNE